MQRTMMKSKIHRATVTGADVGYVGSITLDEELMRLADVREYEQIQVVDIDNGARFATYVIAEKSAGAKATELGIKKAEGGDVPASFDTRQLQEPKGTKESLGDFEGQYDE